MPEQQTPRQCRQEWLRRHRNAFAVRLVAFALMVAAFVLCLVSIVQYPDWQHWCIGIGCGLLGGMFELVARIEERS